MRKPVKLKKQLEELSKRENSYKPNTEIYNQLRKKTLVMVVGPTAIGKSSIMNAAVECNPDFARVSGITSRQPRSNDEPELYEYVTHDEVGLAPIFEKIEHRELVQYAIHPTTRAIYATCLDDFKNNYSLMDTFALVVEGLRRLPFKQSLTIGVAVDPQTWQKWLQERYPSDSLERDNRLKEAVLSFTWLLNQSENEIFWLENKPGELDKAAKQLINICTGKQAPVPYARMLAKQCLEVARQMLRKTHE
jgi:guanylate kinase